MPDVTPLPTPDQDDIILNFPVLILHYYSRPVVSCMPAFPSQIPQFKDDPKWSRLERDQNESDIPVAASCPDWPHQQQVTCEER